MGSADHRFNLAELLSQNYSLREGCAEAPQCPDKPEDQLDKDFVAQVWSLTSLIQLLPLVSMWFAWCCAGPASACSAPQNLGWCSSLLISSVVLMQL